MPARRLSCLAIVALAAGCELGGGRPIVGGLESTAGGGTAGPGTAGTVGAAGTSGAAGTWLAPCGMPSDGESCPRSEPIITCDVPNARDLGGLPVAPAGTVACGQLLRGPPLADLSARGCAEARRLGIRTVIDLRVDSERGTAMDDPCVGANVVLAPLPVPYNTSPANYIADFDTKESIARVFHTLGDPAAYPIYFHCTYGRDRTGVVGAAILLALGASRDDILQEYLLSKTTVGAFPASLTALLDEIDRRGGIEASLRAAGVTAADLATLRAQALAP